MFLQNYSPLNDEHLIFFR